MASEIKSTSPNPKPRFSLVLGLFVIGIATFILVFIVMQDLVGARLSDIDAQVTAIASESPKFTVIDPPRIVADFTLTSHTSIPISLSELQGRPVLLFFGYLHCPDVCPLTLSMYRQVYDSLGSDASEVAFLFVSVDGARDTALNIADYLDARDLDDFVIGVTGDESSLRRIGVDYGLYFEPVNDPRVANNYLVDHTSSVFLIDAHGRLAGIFAFGAEPELVTEQIQVLLT